MSRHFKRMRKECKFKVEQEMQSNMEFLKISLCVILCMCFVGELSLMKTSPATNFPSLMPPGLLELLLLLLSTTTLVTMCACCKKRKRKNTSTMEGELKEEMETENIQKIDKATTNSPTPNEKELNPKQDNQHKGKIRDVQNEHGTARKTEPDCNDTIPEWSQQTETSTTALKPRSFRPSSDEEAEKIEKLKAGAVVQKRDPKYKTMRGIMSDWSESSSAYEKRKEKESGKKKQRKQRNQEKTKERSRQKSKRKQRPRKKEEESESSKEESRRHSNHSQEHLTPQVVPSSRQGIQIQHGVVKSIYMF